MESVTASWAAIEDWLRTHLPSALENLRPPATDADVRRAEESLGIPFPEALRELYRLHDGEENNWPPGAFDDGHWFMPLAAVIEHGDAMAEFAASRPTDSFAAWRSAVEEGVIMIKGPVKPHIACAQWIPFTSSNGDVNRYLDFDPAPGGTPGQVIEHDPEGCSQEVLADSLTAYLARYAQDLAQGRYVVADGGIVDTETKSPDAWPMPEYLHTVAYENVTAADISHLPDEGAVPEGERIDLVGRMGWLMGTGTEIAFSLILAGGNEVSFLATTKETRGFGAIAVDRYARVAAIKQPAATAAFARKMGTEAPAFLVLEYEMVKGPEEDAPGQPWRRF